MQYFDIQYPRQNADLELIKKHFGNIYHVIWAKLKHSPGHTSKPGPFCPGHRIPGWMRRNTRASNFQITSQSILTRFAFACLNIDWRSSNASEISKIPQKLSNLEAAKSNETDRDEAKTTRMHKRVFKLNNSWSRDAKETRNEKLKVLRRISLIFQLHSSTLFVAVDISRVTSRNGMRNTEKCCALPCHPPFANLIA